MSELMGDSADSLELIALIGELLGDSLMGELLGGSARE